MTGKDGSSVELAQLTNQRVVDKKSRKRRTWVLGIASFVVFMMIVGGFLFNINRLATNQAEALDKIEQVQNVQSEGAQRSYLILGNVQCNGQADAEYNALLARLLVAATADDPAVADMLLELQRIADESAARCPTILPPTDSTTTTTTPEVPVEGTDPGGFLGSGKSPTSLNDKPAEDYLYVPYIPQSTTSTTIYVIPVPSNKNGPIPGNANGQTNGRGKNG